MIEMKKILFCFSFMILISTNAWANGRTFEIVYEGKKFNISQQDLEKFKQTTYDTRTNFTAKEKITGPLLIEVRDRFFKNGKMAHVFCHDGYSYKISIDEAVHNGAILAIRRNGNLMSIKELGPFAIVYDRDKMPKNISLPDLDAKTPWQIKRIVVK
ncbi:hypothetical protein [Chromobacterium amazonense]|uniref:hypothetical protein n=1 Tax=Chromobacterium amazonense TaxID=1382803 RepID=UPI001671329F|nr:hypothetical protein [Chromobacterium amazonense]